MSVGYFQRKLHVEAESRQLSYHGKHRICAGSCELACRCQQHETGVFFW